MDNFETRENINAGRVSELRKQNNFLRNENKYLKDNYTRSKASRSRLPSEGSVVRLVSMLLVFLLAMSVYSVLNSPGQSLPSFNTLISALDVLDDRVIITNTSFLDEFRTALNGVLQSIEIIPTEVKNAIVNLVLMPFIPLNIVYFVLTNLWNMLIYITSIVSWFTGGLVDVFPS